MTLHARLTLNLGLRYEFYTVPRDVRGHGGLTGYPGKRVPSAVQMSSPAALKRTTWSCASRTSSDVENAEAVSENTTNSDVGAGADDAGTGDGVNGAAEYSEPRQVSRQGSKARA